MLDLESEDMRGLYSHGIFLSSQNKASDANIGIIAILVHFGKTLMVVSTRSDQECSLTLQDHQ